MRICLHVESFASHISMIDAQFWRASPLQK